MRSSAPGPIFEAPRRRYSSVLCDFVCFFLVRVLLCVVPTHTEVTGESATTCEARWRGYAGHGAGALEAESVRDRRTGGEAVTAGERYINGRSKVSGA